MSRSLILLALLVAFASTVSAQFSQTLPIGLDTSAGGAGSSYPLGPLPATDQKWQLHYDNGNFPQAGPIQITELYFRADLASRNLAAFNFTSFTVTLGEGVTGYQVGQHDPTFAANFGANTGVVRSGPWSNPGVPATAQPTANWVPIGITTPFTFDPSTGNDLIVQLERCGGGTLWDVPCDNVLGTAGVVGGNRYGEIRNCTGVRSITQGNETVPVVRIDYTPQGGFEYEGNDASSSCDIDGVQGNFFTPAVSNRCVSEMAVANFASSNTTLPYDIGITAGPLIPASAGAIISGTGQIVNLDFSAPGGVFFLNGGVFPNLVNTSFPGPFSVPFNTPPVAGDIAAQMFNIDPSSADGLAMSQGAQISFSVGALTMNGPTLDDEWILVPLGVAPICGPASFPFYGTRYPECFLSSNGRISFGAPNSTFAPATLQAVTATEPFFGTWTDYDPATGGTITVNNVGGIIRFEWLQVPYFAAATGANDFNLELHPSNGACVMTGLLGVGTGGASQQCFGISPGTLGGATDPGPVDFTLSAGTTTNATDAIYEYGATGSLATGIDIISFFPNGVGNYDWTAF